MQYFVENNSIVRKIWGRSDVVLFIFAGASAEFALNKAVDWLYFTGKLPNDPLGRLFSTVTFARKIVFSSLNEANRVIDSIKQIHNTIETNRGAMIPDWAYRDVLYMLIHYSISSYELLEKKLTREEKEEVYDVFHRMGTRMGLKELPDNYLKWLPERDLSMAENLQKCEYTSHLFMQYKKHLGSFRFRILIEGQKLVIANRVKELLHFRKYSLLTPFVPVYKFSKRLKIEWIIKDLLLPSEYKNQIKEMDIIPG